MPNDWAIIYQEFPKICKEYYKYPDDYTIQLLNKIKCVKGAISLFDNISSLNKGKTDDLLSEIRYICLFLNCGWIVEKIPRAPERTPDLKVSSDYFSSLIEIKHIRLRNPGPSMITNIKEIEFLEHYGDFERDEKKIRDDIFDAADQIYSYKNRNPDDIPIIALWSSDGDIEEIEIESLLERIINEIREQKPNFPNGILIFGNGWIYRNMKYLSYPIPIRKPLNNKLIEIADKISSILY